MLPSLEDLTLDCYGRGDLKPDAGLMEEMLVSRAKCGKALNSLTLNETGFENFEERSDRMRELVANGLTVCCLQH